MSADATTSLTNPTTTAIVVSIVVLIIVLIASTVVLAIVSISQTIGLITQVTTQAPAPPRAKIETVMALIKTGLKDSLAPFITKLVCWLRNELIWAVISSLLIVEPV